MGINIPGTRALIAATGQVPIVIVDVLDPVGSGLVRSLAHPGGNVTGVAGSVVSGYGAKKFELLKAVVPAMDRLAVLFTPDNPPGTAELHEVQQAALVTGVEVRPASVASIDGLPDALNLALTGAPDALMQVGGNALTSSAGFDQIATFTTLHKLPFIGGNATSREFVARGTLMGLWSGP